MLFDRRLRAYSIDTSLAILLVILIIFSIYDLNLSNNLKNGIIAAVYLGVYIIPNLISPGQTFGKRVQKLRVIKNRGYEGREYQVPARWLLVLRELLKAAFTIFTFGFYLIIAGIASNNRRDGRSIHDFIFGTRVIPLTRYSDERTERVVVNEMIDRLKGTSHND
ncbi:MAG: RDD family protein [Bacilli bacterium]